MDAQQLTRQIYWSPSGGLNELLHKTTYLWLAIAICVFAYGVWKHVKLWRAGKQEICFDRPFDRVILFFRNVVAQAKVLRSRRQRDPKPRSIYAAWMHGLIFYGFLALVFGTRSDRYSYSLIISSSFIFQIGRLWSAANSLTSVTVVFVILAMFFFLL